MSESTREHQYNDLLDIKASQGLSRLGVMMNGVWHEDPRRLLFVLARYKFVAKMLRGKDRVIEIGCGDAFGTRIVQQEVGSVLATDFDPVFLRDIADRAAPAWPMETRQHDFLAGPIAENFDAAYSLDVLEHIPAESEDAFVSNICGSLKKSGVLIIGMPSIQSQPYASPRSKEGHVNCKAQPELRTLMLKYFDNVFSFSMNDETVHTGFDPMANYLIAVCAGKTK